MANDIERKMKKIIVTITSSMLLIIFFSCNSPSHDLNDKDTDLVSDHDNIADADEISEIEADDSNESDENIDDSDNEFSGLSFKTRPHGITRWDEKFSYFIRCESGKKTETLISVTEDDTCKGTINSDTYVFTPINEKIPSGRCVIAVECSDGENRITQKTHIQIPNPFQFIPEPVEQPIVISSLWSNAERVLFTENSGLYSINSNFDNLEVIEKDGVEYLQNFFFMSPVFPANERFYYTSEDGVISTDGTVANKKIILPIEKMEEIFDPLTQFFFPKSIDFEDNIVFLTCNSDFSQAKTWFYSSSEDNFFIIDDEDNWLSVEGNHDDLIYEKNKGEYSFLNKEEKRLVEICHDETGKRPYADAYINGKIFYQYDYDKCLTSLDVSTCQEEKICGCDSGEISILSQLNKPFFHIVNHCENKTVITLYSSGNPEITTEFDGNISEFATNDGTTLFRIEPPHSFSESYKCLRILDMKSGAVVKADVVCSPGELYAYSGFFGEEALFNVLGKTSEHKLLSVTSDGKFKDVKPDMMLTPSVVYVSGGYEYRNGKDQIFIGTANYTQCFETDGNPENIKFIAKSTGNVFSVNDDVIMSSYKFGDYTYLNSFNIANGEKTIVATGQNCENDRRAKFEGFYDYRTTIAGMSLFGIANVEKCGNYSLWTSDGTLAGTIDHEISIYHDGCGYSCNPGKMFPDSTGGFYYGSTHYIENSQKKAITTGVHGTVLGFVGDTLIVYSKDEDYVSETTALQKGKIIGSFINDTSRKLSGITISGNTLQLIETTDGILPETYLISFADGDLSAEPMSALLFDSSFSNIKKVAADDSISIYSAEVTKARGTALKSVSWNNEEITVSETLYYFSKDSAFSGMVISNDRFLFREDSKLLSIPLYEYSYSPFMMFEQIGNFKYIGETFSKEAVIEHSFNDDDNFIIVTDGLNVRSVQREYKYSDISIWNGWAVESGKRFIVEKDSETLEKLEIVSKNAGDEIYATKSLQNIFYRVCDETDRYCDNPDYFIYHLPKTELFF